MLKQKPQKKKHYYNKTMYVVKATRTVVTPKFGDLSKAKVHRNYLIFASIPGKISLTAWRFKATCFEDPETAEKALLQNLHHPALKNCEMSVEPYKDAWTEYYA